MIEILYHPLNKDNFEIKGVIRGKKPLVVHRQHAVQDCSNQQYWILTVAASFFLMLANKLLKLHWPRS